MTPSAATKPARRGRPREADPHEVARVAMRLFERRGFDRVTMDEIAQAASVSRRTLFRLFPSKTDMVWHGVDEVRDAVRLHAASLGQRHDRLESVLDELFVPILRMLDDPDFSTLARRRLKLMARVPTLLIHPALADIEATIALTLEGVAARHQVPAPLVARTLVAAMLSALLWWAEHAKDASAFETTRGALAAISLTSAR